MKTEIYLYRWNVGGINQCEIEIRSTDENGLVQTTRAKISEYQMGMMSIAKTLIHEWDEMPGGYFYKIGPEPPKKESDDQTKTVQG